MDKKSTRNSIIIILLAFIMLVVPIIIWKPAAEKQAIAGYLEGLFLCTPKYANMWYVVAKYQNEPLGWSEQTDEEFKGKIPLWFRNKYPLPENYIAEFLDDNNYFIDLSSRVK